MAEQRGHFCSQWVGAGWVCNTVSAAWGGAGGEKKCNYCSTISTRVFSLFLPLPNKIEQEALWFQMILCKLMHFSRKQIHSQARKAGVGVAPRCAEAFPVYGLHYIQNAFQLETERQHCREMDCSRQLWIHFIAAVAPYETKHQALLSLPLNGARQRLPTNVPILLHKSRIYRLNTCRSSPSLITPLGGPRSTKIVGRAHLSTISQCYT